MSNSKIADLVRNAAGNVPAGYTDRVDAVIRAVEEQAQSIADALLEKGTEMGAREEQVRALLVEVGLIEETPEPEATTTGGDDDVRSQVAELSRRVDALYTAAQRAGVQV